MRSLVSLLFILRLYNCLPCISSKESWAGKEELMMSYVDWNLSRANIIDGCFPPRNLDWIQKHSITSLESEPWSLYHHALPILGGELTVQWVFFPSLINKTLNNSQCIWTMRLKPNKGPSCSESHWWNPITVWVVESSETSACTPVHKI